ncbi:MAG: aminotransferase class IV [Candidatus Omnitrophota bacterium]
MKVFCNTAFVEKETLTEIFEPGFLFGWGVFETLRAYGGTIPFLDLHIQRLNDGLAVLDMDKVALDFEQILRELLKVNDLSEAYIRITAYKKRNSTGVTIYADTFGYYPESAYAKGFTAIVSPYRKATQSPFAQIKSLSFMENRMSWYQAQKVNKDEALLLNQQNYLIGGSRSNLFLVKGKQIFTSSDKSGAFAGITRQIIMKDLLKLRLKVRQAELTLEDLYDSDEAFLSSALLEVMPLVECGSKKIGQGSPGVLTQKISAHYREHLTNH